jgi:hypothetical protein
MPNFSQDWFAVIDRKELQKCLIHLCIELIQKYTDEICKVCFVYKIVVILRKHVSLNESYRLHLLMNGECFKNQKRLKKKH